MQLSRRVVIIILCALFVAAIAARVSTTDRQNTPYYKGASAMAYRHTVTVAEGHSLSLGDAKAGYPEGYVPARYRAAGAETLSGFMLRGVHFVSDMDGRPFTRRLTLLLASLCVFTAYAVSSRLWNSRTSGILAAFLVAFLPALVSATNGRVFSHTIFAAFFASLLAALALRALTGTSRALAVLAAVVALLLLWIWEPARYGLAVWAVAVALLPGIERRARIWFVTGLALAALIGTGIFAHLVATRAIGAWTTAAVLASAGVAWLPEKSRARWRAALYLIGGTALITLVATPLRAGATEQFPALAYVLTRMRYAFGRPDASVLSDWMRHLWSSDHAPITVQQIIQIFVPLGLCAVGWAINRNAHTPRPRFIAAVVLGIVAACATLLDRSALPIAVIVSIVMVSGAAAELDLRRWKQSAWVILAAYVALSGVALRGTGSDVTFQIAKFAGVLNRDPATFTWISFENTDRELIRFISTRTSVHESILASDDLSALILAFSGRTSVQLAGTTSRAPARRHVELTRAFYRDEASFYELCHRDKIDYVVYSIDVLLDSGAYSPRNLAGVSALVPASPAVRMHFDPESLRHFTLLYENDHYRLFKVTDSAQPIFLTDHPLFYQPEIFVRDGRNLDFFQEHIVWLMLTYANAISARARGDAETARRQLDQCLKQAPHFTKARLALADALMDLGHYDTARDEIATVIEYAPDNARALYAAAFVQLQLGKADAARPYLALLAQTGDQEILEKARTLQYYIDHNLPLKPGAPQ